jgi:rod shape-determining protein MreC
MAGPARARTNLLLLAALLFAQLLLMSGSSRNEAGTSLLESGLARVSRPVASATSALSGGFAGFVGFWREVRTAREENVRLKADLGRARGEIERSREQALENGRLRRLLGMREDLAPRSVAASVVTTRMTSQARMIVVDRGAEAGVHPDQAVVAWGGAVGRVVNAGSALAKVRLLTDPNSGVAGLVQRSRAAGMVLGRGDGSLEMLYVPKYADVIIGDRVVTSGLDGVFPRGFGIGRVTLVADVAGATKAIRIEPEVDFRSLEEVLVLLQPVGGSVLAPPGEEEPH